MKIILILIVIGLIGYFGWQAIQTKPDADIPQAVVEAPISKTEEVPKSVGEIPYGDDVITDYKIDNSLVVASFKGFGPGKVHTGSFSNIKSSLYLGKMSEMSGTIVIDMNSFTTDNAKLTEHLKGKEFFDVASYSTASFTLSSIESGKAKGKMTIRGISKEISFPISVRNEGGYTATFTLNMKDFGINQAFANETIELSVTVPFK